MSERKYLEKLMSLQLSSISLITVIDNNGKFCNIKRLFSDVCSTYQTYILSSDWETTNCKEFSFVQLPKTICTLQKYLLRRTPYTIDTFYVS